MEAKLLLSSTDIAHALDRMACEIIEKHGECGNMHIVGIERRGADLARRMNAILQAKLGCELPLSTLDINLYRDDWTSMQSTPHVGPSRMSPNVDKADVLLIDDVLYTGRTIRSALEAIMDFGRPARVELLVLVDRGRRELPIQADYIGRALHTEADERVDVYLNERDGKDEVRLIRR